MAKVSKQLPERVWSAIVVRGKPRPEVVDNKPDKHHARYVEACDRVVHAMRANGIFVDGGGDVDRKELRVSICQVIAHFLYVFRGAKISTIAKCCGWDRCTTHARVVKADDKLRYNPSFYYLYVCILRGLMNYGPQGRQAGISDYGRSWQNITLSYLEELNPINRAVQSAWNQARAAVTIQRES